MVKLDYKNKDFTVMSVRDRFSGQGVLPVLSGDITGLSYGW